MQGKSCGISLRFRNKVIDGQPITADANTVNTITMPSVSDRMRLSNILVSQQAEMQRKSRGSCIQD